MYKANILTNIYTCMKIKFIKLNKHMYEMFVHFITPFFNITFELGVCVDKQKPKPRSKRSLQFSTVTSPLEGSVEVDRIFIVMF